MGSSLGIFVESDKEEEVVLEGQQELLDLEARIAQKELQVKLDYEEKAAKIKQQLDEQSAAEEATRRVLDEQKKELEFQQRQQDIRSCNLVQEKAAKLQHKIDEQSAAEEAKRRDDEQKKELEFQKRQKSLNSTKVGLSLKSEKLKQQEKEFEISKRKNLHEVEIEKQKAEAAKKEKLHELEIEKQKAEALLKESREKRLQDLADSDHLKVELAKVMRTTYDELESFPGDATYCTEGEDSVVLSYTNLEDLSVAKGQIMKQLADLEPEVQNQIEKITETCIAQISACKTLDEIQRGHKWGEDFVGTIGERKVLYNCRASTAFRIQRITAQTAQAAGLAGYFATCGIEEKWIVGVSYKVKVKISRPGEYNISREELAAIRQQGLPQPKPHNHETLKLLGRLMEAKTQSPSL